ncbi:alpha/beta hydrolase family protein [Paenibacillus allorhizosphaerae]|uniref:Acetyl xylan esterase domain-containing protein n=1 Tax=Paenibacillus allorhizosphaerae TaxID=2849866 RepID=A0ABN7TP93_9BACL|nr:prolyl oligopeptidase family serine peptidase [Paenibacillus allorhizosphaerae]CAG7644511.1 hypothetical protein PAECIP111802_03290 [Paenibacillus allorhizosphaerae]
MENARTPHEANHSPWDLQKLYQSPQSFPAYEMNDDEIQAVLLEGMPYQGRPTRFFAYYSVPAAVPGETVPAMVLVHGGGGTAFKEWVQLWNARGYAAIAMDLEGHLPTAKNSDGTRPQHEWSGPSRQGEFQDFALPTEDQWMYHAAADVILAHSFLRSLDHVDCARIGITGISWGGIVTGIVAGVDDRFAFGVPVYGCGYLYESSNKYGQSFAAMPADDSQKIKNLWDPSAYLPRVSFPMLWLTWSGDPHFPLHLFSKSYVTARNGFQASGMSIHFELGHSHAAGWKRQEIYSFADQMTRGGTPLPQVLRYESGERRATVGYSSGNPVLKAELYYATDTSDWFEMQWNCTEAAVDANASEIHAAIPEGTAAYFIQLTDTKEQVVSTPVTILSHTLEE